MSLRALALRAWLVVGALTVLAGCSKKADAPPDGAALFRGGCARCHGESGTGGVPQGGVVPRNFVDHAFQTSHTDAQLKSAITGGKGTAMPGFGTTFSDAELSAIVAYVRTFDPKVAGAPADAPADGGGKPQ